VKSIDVMIVSSIGAMTTNSSSPERITMSAGRVAAWSRCAMIS